MLVLLTRVRLSHASWGILRDRTQKIGISEACAPFWEWLQVRFLTDYVGNLDHQLSYLLEPPKSAESTKLRVELFKQAMTPLT